MPEAAALFRGSLGAYSGAEELSMRTEADTWVAAFTREQARSPLRSPLDGCGWLWMAVDGVGWRWMALECLRVLASASECF